MDDKTFASDDHLLETFHSKRLGHHTGKPFCLEFNGKIESFKTRGGYLKRIRTLIARYDLKEV